MADIIDDYTPRLPDEHWAEIGPFVRSAVHDCDIQTPYRARDLVTPAAYLTHWAWQVAGLPLDRDLVFRRETIEEFIQRAPLDLSAATRGNYRSRLLRMSEILVAPQHRVVRLTPLPASNPTAPYTADEVTTLRSWATGQKSTYRQVNCHVLLSLGFGAGLSASEIMSVHARDILVDRHGVLVTASGPRPRTIPVLAEWEPALIALSSAAIRPDMYLFRPRRTVAVSRNLITNFVTNHTASPLVHLSTQRMRTTWIVTHLAAGTPAHLLVKASGVSSLEALTRFLTFLPDVDPATARRTLRDAHRKAAQQ